MAAPIIIMRSGLSGFSASEGMDPNEWANPFGSRVGDAEAKRLAGGITLGLGVAGLAGGYALYKKGHPVAGVVVALLFGAGVITGPIMLASK